MTFEGYRMLLQFTQQGLIRYHCNELFEMSFVSSRPIHRVSRSIDNVKQTTNYYDNIRIKFRY